MTYRTAKFILKHAYIVMVVPILLFAISSSNMPRFEPFWIDSWGMLIKDDIVIKIMGSQFIVSIALGVLVARLLRAESMIQCFRSMVLVWVSLSLINLTLFSMVSAEYIFPWICMLLIAPSIYWFCSIINRAEEFVKNKKENEEY